MLCQTCSALNDDEREYCFRCQAKLLVLSGVSSFEEDEVEDGEGHPSSLEAVGRDQPAYAAR